jgi:LmbE family N-acetylglucosaminyl deacetylase
MVVSPHDDDGIIGAGGLIAALAEEKKEVSVVIMTDGRLGYSKPEDRWTIVQTRAREAVDSYHALGVARDNINFLGYPDMSLWPYCAWKTPEGYSGGYRMLLIKLRHYKPQVVFIPNPEDIHPDHRATFEIARVAIWQAQKPVAADMGKPFRIERIFAYQTWQDLSEITHSFNLALYDSERKLLRKRKREALARFNSQKDIIASISKINFDEEVFREYPAEGF